MSRIAQLSVPSDGFSPGIADYWFADWLRGRIYLCNSSYASIRGYFAILGTQSPYLSGWLTPGHDADNASGGDADPLNGAVIIQAGGGNGVPINRYDPLTFAQTGTYGAASTLPSYPTSIWFCESIVCVSCGTLASGGVTQASYALIKENAFSGHVAVVRIDTTPMQHAGAYLNVVSGSLNSRGLMCRGASGAAGASAFLTWGDVSGSPASYPLYKVSIAPGAETYDPATWPATNPHISASTVGSIAASAIDPAWTGMVVSDIGYDQADGNVLIEATSGGAAHPHYIAKVNAATAAVMWATPIATTSIASLSGGRINGRLPVLRNGTFDAIDLSDGSDKAQTYNGVVPQLLSLTGPTVVAGDSMTGLMLLTCGYTQGTGSPVPVDGTPSSFSGWALADWPDPYFPLPAEIKKVLLPSAELQFDDANGHPYAGGTLELLIPGTTTPKDTWSDPDGVALNTNPIVLDAAGRCIIYGDGKYRTILKDAFGNLIWDRESTTEVSAAMTPVTGAPTIAEARRLLGIDDGSLADEAAARAAADALETAQRIAADANLQAEIDAETAARIAADAALAAIGGPNVRAGSVTTNSSGYARITFATPFPTACTGIVATPGGQHAPTPLTADTNTPDVNGCDVYTGIYSGTSGVAPASTLVYYIAVGN